MGCSTKRKDFEDIFFGLTTLSTKVNNSQKNAMAKMLGGLPISFIGEMNKKLFKTFTILHFSKLLRYGWARQKGLMAYPLFVFSYLNDGT